MVKQLFLILIFIITTGSSQSEHYHSMWNDMMSRNSWNNECVPDWCDDLQFLTKERQLELVNQYINKVTFRSDLINWQQKDYWASPNEFLLHGGDCEDYVIAKYFILRYLGFSAQQLQILIVWDVKKQKAHAILTVEQEDGISVLDNIEERILYLFQFPHYIVKYRMQMT